MAESTAYARRGYIGGTKPSTIAGGLSASATSFTGADLATWAGVTTNGPVYIEASYDTTTPEVMEAGSVSGNSVTSVVRGRRNTSAREHDPNCKIRVVHTDRDFDEANKLVNAIFGISGLASGDLLYLTSATALARLAKGAAYQALLMNAGATAPVWGDSLASLLTAQGDLPYASAANTPARLAKGAAWRTLAMNQAATAPAWASGYPLFVFADATARDAAVTSPVEGMFAWLTGTDVLTYYTGAAWANFVVAPTNGTAAVETAETITATSPANFATAGPTVTITTGTKALVAFYADVYSDTASAYNFLGVDVSGATTIAANALNSRRAIARQPAGSGSHEINMGKTVLFTGLTPGSNVFKMQGWVSAGTSSYAGRRMTVMDGGS